MIPIMITLPFSVYDCHYDKSNNQNYDDRDNHVNVVKRRWS